MSAARVTGEDFVTAARFIAASVERIRSLTAEQRHEAAGKVTCGLRRLASTIRVAQADHGFMADLVLADGLALIDGLETF